MSFTAETSHFELFSEITAHAIQLFAIDPLLDEVDALAETAKTSDHDKRHDARMTLAKWRETIDHARESLQPHIQPIQNALYHSIFEMEDEAAPEPVVVLTAKTRSVNGEMLLETLRLFDDCCLAHATLLQHTPTYRPQNFEQLNVAERIQSLLKALYLIILNIDPTH